MAHGKRRLPLMHVANTLGWCAGSDAVLGDIFQHKRARSNFGAGANTYVSEDDGVGTNEHVIANLGVTVTVLFTSAAKGDTVKDGDAVSDNCGLTDNDAVTVVEQDAAAETGTGVNVDAESLAHSGLQSKSEEALTASPHLMGDTVGLDGMEALEVEETVGEGGACRVARVHGTDVMAGVLDKLGGLCG